MIYTVKNRIKRNGQVFEKGASIELSEDEAVVLADALATEVVEEMPSEEATEEVAEVVEEKPKARKTKK